MILEITDWHTVVYASVNGNYYICANKTHLLKLCLLFNYCFMWHYLLLALFSPFKFHWMKKMLYSQHKKLTIKFQVCCEVLRWSTCRKEWRRQIRFYRKAYSARKHHDIGSFKWQAVRWKQFSLRESVQQSSLKQAQRLENLVITPVFPRKYSDHIIF